MGRTTDMVFSASKLQSTVCVSKRLKLNMANISNISTETIKCNAKGKISLLSSSKRTRVLQSNRSKKMVD